eukprot:GGOE01031921.1.p1 GENE.GGOE01031921.1~~GGOE01031921.1.p1  ORF type:complete len:1175 (-),score=343.57 GGOE01031921.1:655-3936(-)
MCTASDMTSPLAVDFAGSDALLTASDYSQYPDLQMYPTMAGAVVPIFNLGSITNLTFPTFLLAKVFAGTVRYWDDASILALNPHLNGSIPSNQPIILVVRSDSSGTTQIFKKALAAFDSAFRSQIGTASSNVWTNVTATQRSGNQGVVSYVMSTKYTLGYSELGVALTNNLPMVKLQKANGSIVTASITSTDYAVLEMGLSFGNNGDDAARLTADLEDAQGSNAWPIVGYTYLVMRKSTLRSGATCENVRQTVAFWYWFWTSKVAANIVEEDKFLALPSVVLDVVLSRFVADITCNGQVVYEKTVLVPVNGQGTDLVSELFTTLVNVYSLVDSTVNLTFTADDSSGYAADTDLVRTMFSASTNSALGAPPNGYKLIFAGAGLAVISQVNVTLNGLTLAQILQGDITTWLDPAIAALNPWGVRDANGAIITNTSHQIQLLQGPSASSASLQSLMTAFLSTYTGAAILGAPMSASEDILRYSVLGSPWALSITPYTGTFPAGLQLVPYRHSDGSVVDPSWQAIKACASDDTFVTSLNSFQLASSQLSSCYPLALSVHIRVRKSQCDTVNDAPRTAAANLIGWMFSNAALKNALQAANLAPLTDANVAATAANQAVLDAISCSTASSSGFPFFIIIVMCAVGGVFLLLIPALVWHSTRRMRALRKQFSNDNVAQECAAAIARFDLESVAWLSGVKNPNKIQKSFVQIVHLLTEVKPFIPDQLLHQLTGEGEATEQDGDDPGREREGKPLLTPRGSAFFTTRRSQRSYSQRSGEASSTCSASDGEVSPRKRPTPGGQRKCSHMLPTQMGQPQLSQTAHPHAEVEQKWSRKHCAWLHAELKTGSSLDDPNTLVELSTVVTSLVSVAKKEGATIERVGVETVVVHWGLSGRAAQAAQRATLTGMEMSAIVKQKFSCLQTAFQLRISITYGSCHVSTLSASGYRFFISAGTEMSLATRLVHDRIFEKCGCTLLMSSAVYKEVQYNVKCLPRAWFRDVLVWEPVRHLTHREDDEWMYELQKIEGAEGADSKDRALTELFGMVSPTASATAIQRAARSLQEQYNESLTAEDSASVDNLIASLEQIIPVLPSLSVTSVEEELN